MSNDFRMAHGVLYGFKVAITGVAALLLLVGLFTVWREAFNDQSGGEAIAQGLVGTVLTVLGVGVAWAVLMLPVWLLSGWTAKQS